MDYGLHSLWATPVMRFKIQDINITNQFIQYLFTNINVQKPPCDSEKHDIIRDGNEVCQAFKEQVIDPAFDTYIKAISNESLADFENYKYQTSIRPVGKGSVIGCHNHHTSVVSAVFYLLCDEQDKGGTIKLLDPKTNAERGYNGHFPMLFKSEEFIPNTGDILMFPSYLYHYTSQFMGSVRLLLAVDLYHKDLEGTGVSS